MSRSHPYPANPVKILLFVAVLFEILSSTFWLESFSLDACRWIHFLSGLSIGALILVRTDRFEAIQRVPGWINYLLLLVLLTWIGVRLTYLFKLNPLDYTHADMLPVIQVMAQRFCQGQPIYDIIPEIWGGVKPVYLPGLWFPFIPAVIFDFDLRWITTSMIVLGLFFMFALNQANTKALLVWIPIGLWFDYILYNRNETLVLSEEGVVYGYYILFALALYRRSYIWIGVLLACCLLSRYSIVFFAVALLVCFRLYESKEKFQLFFVATATAGLVLMTLGGAWTQLTQFAALPNQYLKNLETNPSKYQDIMKEALGFVPWLQELEYQTIYWIMLLLLMGIMILTIYFYRKLTGPFFLLAALKFTLLFFYHFVLIPYPYLFYTSVWVSVVIFYLYASRIGPVYQTEII